MAGERILNIKQEKLDIIQDFWRRQGAFGEAWLGNNIALKQWLPSNFRWTVNQGMESMSTTSASATRRSRKKKRETNATTREILNKILWLKLHRRQKQGYLCPTYHCKT